MGYQIPTALCTLALGLGCFAALAQDNLTILLIQAPNDAARSQLLAPIIKTNPQATLGLMAQLKQLRPTLAKSVLRDALVLLAQNPTHLTSKVSNQLIARNPELIEQLADEVVQVESAEGPEQTRASFADTAAALPVPLENPNQISANQP